GVVDASTAAISITYEDTAGNTGASSPDIVIDSGGVTFDFTAPTFTAISLTSTTTQVNFSEAIDGTLTFSEWTFDSKVVSAVSGQSDGATLNNITTLTFTHATTTDTTPTVSYTPGNLADASGDALATATVTATDGTVPPPTITIASVNTPSPTVTGTSQANASIEVFSDAVSVGTGTADGSGDWTVSITVLADGAHTLTATATVSDNTSPLSSGFSVTVDSTNENTLIFSSPEIDTITVTESNTTIVVPTDGFTSSELTIDVSNDDVFMDWNNEIVTTAEEKTLTFSDGFTINRDTDTNGNPEVITTIFANTVLSASTEWDGTIELITVTTVTIPSANIQTFETQIVIKLGSDERLNLDTPIRLEFPTKGGQSFGAFFQQEGQSVVLITTICNEDSLDSASAQLESGQECIFDDDSSIIIWTRHLTSFGVHKASAVNNTGSAGATGASPGTGAGAGGFGGILGTPLTINEISYDKCAENIARILIFSDATNPPSVTVHTTRTGSVAAILSDEQPYEELNKITRVDKYLYEIPIASDETFLMIIVTEEKGTIQNTVNAAINLTSCEGTISVADVPEDEFDELVFTVPRIFDTKFQIDNGPQHRADSDSQSFYVSEQDLTITAIIDSETPLKRVELRTITLGQSDDEYIAMKMNVEPMIFFNTYMVSATIPSFLMQDPAIAYWIYVIDEELNEVESVHYTMGVKPILEPDVSLELDVPSIKQSGSIVRPSLFINNDQSPAYGIVSLVVDGKVVSERAEFFGTGQTKVSFDWKVPSSGELSTYELQGKVDLYGSTEITSSALLYSHPRTLSMSAYDMQTIQVIEKDGNVLLEPVLLYASNTQTDEFKFQVTAPNGQCIIGSSEECSVQDSTRSDRGGLASVQYDGQTLRIKYSGPDSSLERFSITSIDPIVGDWIVTLEAEEGFIPLAQAVKDLTVKVKHRINSETITVYSD
ncbi:MAG: hypothetical protein IIB80_06950, partial [Thaumarchaeota archaeon]|nr:hypothetical protein [Nitrososphaerota archaeon]